MNESEINGKDDYFDYSYEGYNEARDYLEDTNQEHLIENEVSTDGRSIIRLANSLKHIEEKQREIDCEN